MRASGLISIAHRVRQRPNGGRGAGLGVLASGGALRPGALRPVLWGALTLSAVLVLSACTGSESAARVATPAQAAEEYPAQAAVEDSAQAAVEEPESETESELGGESSTEVEDEGESEGESGVEEEPESALDNDLDGNEASATTTLPPTTTSTTTTTSSTTSTTSTTVVGSSRRAKLPVSEKEKEKLLSEGGNPWSGDPEWKINSGWNKSLEWEELTDDKTGMLTFRVSALGGKYLCEIENTQDNWNKIYIDDDPLSAGCVLTVQKFLTTVDEKMYSCRVEVEHKKEIYDKIYVDKDPIGAGCKRVYQREWCVEGSAEEKVALQLHPDERECNTPLWMPLFPYCKHETEVTIYNWREQPDPNAGSTIRQPELYIIDPYLYFYNNGEKRFRKNCTTLLAHFGEVYAE